MDTVEVRRVPEKDRYEILEGGEVAGYAEYYELRGDIVLPHTVITPKKSGRGLGGKLVQGVLDDIRREGRKVVPLCSFVEHWIETHPEERDLLAQHQS